MLLTVSVEASMNSQLLIERTVHVFRRFVGARWLSWNSRILLQEDFSTAQLGFGFHAFQGTRSQGFKVREYFSFFVGFLEASVYYFTRQLLMT
jgi:hypothetical protein